MNARLERWIELLRRLQPQSARGRKLLVWIGYPAFGLVVMMMTLLGSVPQDRVKDRLESALSADPGNPAEPLGIGMDVAIGELSTTLLSGIGVNAKDIVLRSRPLNPMEKPARYIVDELRLRMGLFGLLFNHPSYHFKAHALQGTITGDIDNSVEMTRANLQVDKVSLGSVPGLPLPLDGTVAGKLDLDVPKNLLANASGNLEIEIDNAAIGDGKAKLTVPNDPFLAAGVTVPRIRLGKLSGAIVIEKGRARFDNVRAHSADADATLEGYVELHDPMPTSQVHAYLKFRPSEALTKKEPTIDLLVNAMASTAKRSDGYIGVQMTGPLSAVFYLPSKDPPFGVTTRNEPAPAAPPSTPPAASAAPPVAPPSGPPATPPVLGPPSGPSANEPPAPTPPPPPPPQPGAAPGTAAGAAPGATPGAATAAPPAGTLIPPPPGAAPSGSAPTAPPSVMPPPPHEHEGPHEGNRETPHEGAHEEAPQGHRGESEAP